MNTHNQIAIRNHTEEAGSIDYMHYINLLRRNLFKILIFSFVTVVIAYLVLMNVKNVYTAHSTIQIEEAQANIVSIQDVYGIPKNSEYLATQFQILKSRELARRVVLAQNLVSEPEFNPFHEENLQKFSVVDSVKDFVKSVISSGEGEGNLPRVIPEEEEIIKATTSVLMDHMTSQNVVNTSLVLISVSSYNPVLAKNLANSFGREYINFKLEEKLGVTAQASDWLRERLDVLKQQLEDSEKKLQQYRVENNLIDLKGVDTLVTQQIRDITSRLSEAKAKRVQLESMFVRLRDIDETDPSELMSIPAIVNNTSVTSLVQQENLKALRISELSHRYGEKHPKMISAQNEYQSAKEALLQQLLRVSESIKSEYQAARITEAMLTSSLEQVKREAGDVNQNEFTVNMLTREVETNRQLYDMFFKRINETSATGNFEVPNAIITDPAVIPATPSAPKKQQILGIVFIFSVAVAYAFIMLLDFLDSTIKNVDELTRKIPAPVLGVLPLMKGVAKKGASETDIVKAFADEENHAFSESLRTIRTTLTLASMERSAQVLLFTSSIPGEGKTTLSCNVAQAFGQTERTLLIDCDMRRPTVAKKLGLLPYVPGLSNAVGAPETLNEAIQKIPHLGIDVITSGPIPSNPLELLSSSNFRTILNELRQRYDRIIIDSAPMHAVSDALYLSTLTDGVAYVVKADSTRDKFVKMGIQWLHDGNARVLGTILNQVDIEREAKYGDGQYGYYDSYGYSSRNS